MKEGEREGRIEQEREGEREKVKEILPSIHCKD